MKSPPTSTWTTLLTLIVGLALAAILATGEEKAVVADFHPTPLAVETLNVTREAYRLHVPAWGFVAPRETIDVRTEVAGKVTAVAPDLLPGATVAKGAALFSLDDRSYRNALAEATAAHERVCQDLALELGRQAVARNEWALLIDAGLEEVDKKAHKSLILRKPQLKSCTAAVKMAAARQAQAALEVERTRVVAPCEGVIVSEDLAAGQVLESGDVALRLACTESYHLIAAFASTYTLDMGAELVNIAVDARTFAGTIKAVLPEIDPNTRQKRVLVVFTGEDISIGTYAAMSLPGPAFEAVVVLPAEAMRPGGTVWVLNAGNKLEIRPVKVLARDPLQIVIGEGLNPGEAVILSHIANPLRGMPLRRSTAGPEDAHDRGTGRRSAR